MGAASAVAQAQVLQDLEEKPLYNVEKYHRQESSLMNQKNVIKARMNPRAIIRTIRISRIEREVIRLIEEV